MTTDPEQARRTEHERSKARQAHGAAQQTAHERAAQGSIDLSRLQSPDMIDELFSPDIDPDPDDLPEDVAGDLEAKLAAEFGRHLGLGNITRDEYEERRIDDEAEALLVQQEFRRPAGRSGGKCTGAIREIVTGKDDARPELTPDRSRRIKSAMEERSMLRSLSIDARGFRGLTEAIVYTRSEGFEESGGGGGGVLSRVAGVLP